MSNAHGLSRSIPAGVKREVQRRCGHGCIYCGATIIEYEHFAPEFADAKCHDADGITLLCPTHHALTTKGIITKQMVARQNRTPAAVAKGFSSENHPWFEGLPTVHLGDAVLTGIPVPVRIHGENFLEFSPAEDGGPTLLSGTLRTALGGPMLSIVQNEWRVHSGEWEFQNVGRRYEFHHPGTPFGLTLRLAPPNEIFVEKLVTITSKGIPLEITPKGLILGSARITTLSMHGCRFGIVLE